MSLKDEARKVEYPRVEVFDSYTLDTVRYNLGLSEGDLGKLVLDGKILPVVTVNGGVTLFNNVYTLGIGEFLYFGLDGIINIVSDLVGGDIRVEYAFNGTWIERYQLVVGTPVYDMRIVANVTRLNAVAAGHVSFHGHLYGLAPLIPYEELF